VTRVLQVLGRSTGGIARHVAAIVAGLEGRDGLTFDVAGPPDLPVSVGTSRLPVTVPDGAVRGHPGAIEDLARILRSGDYQVVHAHGLRAALDTGIAGLGAPPVRIATIHNLLLPEIGGRVSARAFGPTEGLVSRLHRHVLAPSRDIGERLQRRAPNRSGRIEVLHLGVGALIPPSRGTEDVRRELGFEEGQRVIATVARLAPQKALEVLLEALTHLRDDVVAAVVGTGPSHDELVRRAHGLGVARRVRWLGYRDDATEIVAAADVFALTSVWEACSLAAQEAIALGVPVVSTNVGGMPELVTDRVSGRLVSTGDSDGIARAIAEILGSPEQARVYSEAAAANLARHFSIEVMLGRLRDLYLAEAAVAD
jgi:glycosyltransferase involved in cell wall biosynthesis